MDHIEDKDVFAYIPYEGCDKRGIECGFETNPCRGGYFVGDKKYHPDDEVGKNGQKIYPACIAGTVEKKLQFARKIEWERKTDGSKRHKSPVCCDGIPKASGFGAKNFIDNIFVILKKHDWCKQNKYKAYEAEFGAVV